MTTPSRVYDLVAPDYQPAPDPAKARRAALTVVAHCDTHEDIREVLDALGILEVLR